MFEKYSLLTLIRKVCEYLVYTDLIDLAPLQTPFRGDLKGFFILTVSITHKSP